MEGLNFRFFFTDTVVVDPKPSTIMVDGYDIHGSVWDGFNLYSFNPNGCSLYNKIRRSIHKRTAIINIAVI